MITAAQDNWNETHARTHPIKKTPLIIKKKTTQLMGLTVYLLLWNYIQHIENHCDNFFPTKKKGERKKNVYFSKRLKTNTEKLFRK